MDHDPRPAPPDPMAAAVAAATAAFDSVGARSAHSEDAGTTARARTAPISPACQACGRYRYARFPFLDTHVEGDGPVDYLIIGQAPGYEHEDRHGRHMIGPTSQRLRRAEQTVGLRPQFTVARQNAVRCAAPGDPVPTKQEIAHCRELLHRDIQRLRPALVLPMGNAAVQAVQLTREKISRCRGTLVEKDGQTYLPLYHVAAVEREPSRYEEDFLTDLTSAKNFLLHRATGDSVQDRLQRRYRVVETEAELFGYWIPFLVQHGGPLWFDCEYTPLDQLAASFRVLSIQFAWGPRTGVAIPLDHPDSPFRGNHRVQRALVRLCEHVPLAGTNVQVDVHCLVTLGATVSKLTIVDDTMLKSLVVTGVGGGSHRLKDHATRYGIDTAGYEDTLEAFKRDSLKALAIHQRAAPAALIPSEDQQWADAFAARWGGYDALYDGSGYHKIPLRLLLDVYGCGDVDTSAQVNTAMNQLLVEQQADRYYHLIFRHAWLHNYLMWRRGLCIDQHALRERGAYFQAELDRCTEQMLALPGVRDYAEALAAQGKTFSLGSDAQMRDVLFQLFALPLPPGRTAKTKAVSLDVENLARLCDLTEHPAPRILQAYSFAEKKFGTDVEGLAKVVYPDGRVHPQFHSFTHSRRRGSRAPNVQNQTIGRPEQPLSNMRVLFTATPPWNRRDRRRFVSPDFKQLEFRTAANYAADFDMIACCKESDPHRRMSDVIGALMRDHGIAGVVPRRPSKTVNFSVIYGAHAATVQAKIKADLGLDWPDRFAELVVEAAQALYPTLFTHIPKVHQQITACGYAVTILGNRRPLPEARSTEYRIRAEAQRQGWNHCNQALGHDLLALVMLCLQDHIWSHDLDWHLVNDNHDGFMLETPEAEADLAGRVCLYLMEEVPRRILPPEWHQAPILAEISYGAHYGHFEADPSVVPMAVDIKPERYTYTALDAARYKD